MKVKTGLRVPGRVRKERPTYTMFTPPNDVPLIRCTMPTPCKVCWYCKQSVAKWVLFGTFCGKQAVAE